MLKTCKYQMLSVSNSKSTVI